MDCAAEQSSVLLVQLRQCETEFGHLIRESCDVFAVIRLTVEEGKSAPIYSFYFHHMQCSDPTPLCVQSGFSSGSVFVVSVDHMFYLQMTQSYFCLSQK